MPDARQWEPDMCGIAGLWAPQLIEAERRARVDAMSGSLRHRGPDAGGAWSDERAGLVLGHRRLAVVGLGEAGSQPMVSRSGRWVLTYNGEIYNRAEVRRLLEAGGSTFRGTSDTEVLVEAIDAWGPERALAAIDGMFCFGAWDGRDRTLVLARDRLGEKPLAYGPVGRGFAFASELTALRTLPDFDVSLDPAAVALFLRFKCVPAPWTIHAGIRKLPPGTWIEVGEGGRTVGDPVPYWSYGEQVEKGAADQVAVDEAGLDELDRLVRRAVRRQLDADVPVGAFLSGGIDSSLVATVAAEELSEPLRTFTIGSPDADHDERRQARAVAERIGADHTELVIQPADALAEIPGLASIWDEPFADSSQLPMLLVSRLARQHVTVAVSGDGGDELFGGYNRHTWLPSAWSRIGPVPTVLRRAGARALRWPRPSSWDRAARALPESRRPRLLGVKVQKFSSVLDASDPAAAYGRLVSHWDDPERIVRGAVEPATRSTDSDLWPQGGSLARSIMAVDALTYLPDDVLVKVDRAAMAVSLETRVPLLDRLVVEYATRLPIEALIDKGRGKLVLRQLLERRHPAELFDRPKSGFGVPIASWLRDELRPWAEELLSIESLGAGGLLDPDPIRDAWHEHQAGRRDRSYELWDVLMLQGWRRANDPVA